MPSVMAFIILDFSELCQFVIRKKGDNKLLAEIKKIKAISTRKVMSHLLERVRISLFVITKLYARLFRL